MYKIVFVVAVFAFALQGALSSPVDTEAAPTLVQQKASNNGAAVESKPNDITTVTADVITTTEAPNSGASSTEMCLLLVQVSSLALVAKHMLL